MSNRSLESNECNDTSSAFGWDASEESDAKELLKSAMDTEIIETEKEAEVEVEMDMGEGDQDPIEEARQERYNSEMEENEDENDDGPKGIEKEEEEIQARKKRYNSEGWSICEDETDDEKVDEEKDEKDGKNEKESVNDECETSQQEQQQQQQQQQQEQEQEQEHQETEEGLRKNKRFNSDGWSVDEEFDSGVSDLLPRLQSNDLTIDAENDINSVDRQLLLIAELENTEETYLELLKVFKRVYMNPIQSKDKLWKRKLLDNRFVAVSFSYIDQIIVLGEAFLSKLKEACGNETVDNHFDNTERTPEERVEACCIIASNFSGLFKLYAQYASNYHRTVTFLESYEKESKMYENFISSNQARARGNRVETFLIMPIQRLPRYELLLKQILSENPAPRVLHAKTQLEAATKFINEAVRSDENRQKLVDFQGRFKARHRFDVVSGHAKGRKLIKSGTVIKASKQGEKFERVEFACFTDCIVYCDIRKGIRNSKRESLKLRRMIPINEIEIVPYLAYENPDYMTENSLNLRFILKTPLKQFTFYASTRKERDEWLDSIQGILPKPDLTLSYEDPAANKTTTTTTTTTTTSTGFVGLGNDDEDNKEEEEEEEGTKQKDPNQQQSKSPPLPPKPNPKRKPKPKDNERALEELLQEPLVNMNVSEGDFSNIWNTLEEERVVEQERQREIAVGSKEGTLQYKIEQFVSNETEYVENFGILVETFVRPILDFIDGASLRHEKQNRSSTKLDGLRSQLASPDVTIALHSLIQLHFFHEAMIDRFQAIVVKHHEDEETHDHDINKNKNHQESIGEILETIIPLLSLYTSYSARHDILVETIQSRELEDVRRSCERDEKCQGKPAILFFEVPIKRLDYYYDALQAMLKLTPKEESSCLLRCSEKLLETIHGVGLATSKLQTVDDLIRVQNSLVPTKLTLLNKFLHATDRSEQLHGKMPKGNPSRVYSLLTGSAERIPQIISDHRSLLLEASMVKVAKKRLFRCQVWLFNDMLMYGTPFGNKKFRFHRSFRISNCIAIPAPDPVRKRPPSLRDITPIPAVNSDTASHNNESNRNHNQEQDGNGLSMQLTVEQWATNMNDQVENHYFKVNPNAFKLRTTTKSFVFIADTVEAKHEWTQAINQAAADMLGQSVPGRYIFYLPVRSPLQLNNNCQVCENEQKGLKHCEVCGRIVCTGCSGIKRYMGGVRTGRVCNLCQQIPELLQT